MKFKIYQDLANDKVYSCQDNICSSCMLQYAQHCARGCYTRLPNLKSTLIIPEKLYFSTDFILHSTTDTEICTQLLQACLLHTIHSHLL